MTQNSPKIEQFMTDDFLISFGMEFFLKALVVFPHRFDSFRDAWLSNNMYHVTPPAVNKCCVLAEGISENTFVSTFYSTLCRGGGSL